MTTQHRPTQATTFSILFPPAYGAGDGRDSFMCINPVGGEQDRAAILSEEKVK